MESKIKLNSGVASLAITALYFFNLYQLMLQARIWREALLPLHIIQTVWSAFLWPATIASSIPLKHIKQEMVFLRKAYTYGEDRGLTRVLVAFFFFLDKSDHPTGLLLISLGVVSLCGVRGLLNTQFCMNLIH